MNPRPAPQCDYQRSVLSAVADGAGNVGTNQGEVSRNANLDALRSQWPTMVELAIQLFPGINVYFAHAGDFFESFVFFDLTFTCAGDFDRAYEYVFTLAIHQTKHLEQTNRKTQ
jgi:hypothetical protein